MDGTSEAKEPVPVKIIGPSKGKWPMSPKVIAVVAVVAIVIVAIVAYAALMMNEEEGLEATVSPETLTLNAGATESLEATATWNGDPANASATTYSWSVSDPGLGNFSEPNSRATLFQAAEVGGEGTITCNVTYTSDDGTSSVEVDVDLVVIGPTLASVEITPPGTTLVYDRAVVFNMTAEDSLGDEMTDIADENITWTVWGLPSANYTLNSTHGASVNLTANMTGTILLNVTAMVDGVSKSTSVTVQVIEAAPTVTLSHTKLPAGAGVNWTWAEPTQPLMWDEITIQLTDGTSTVNWSLTMEGLNGGEYNTSQFAPQLLGSLTVYLNITDVDGNGAVNSTDFFLFTTSGGKFNPIGNYVLTWIFEPTGIDVVAEMAFNG